MARRRTRKFGASTTAHRMWAREAAEYVREDVKIVRKALARGDCKSALSSLMVLKGNAAALSVNRTSMNKKLKSTHSGTFRVINGLIGKVNACYMNRGKSSYERNNED